MNKRFKKKKKYCWVSFMTASVVAIRFATKSVLLRLKDPGRNDCFEMLATSVVVRGAPQKVVMATAAAWPVQRRAGAGDDDVTAPRVSTFGRTQLSNPRCC